MKIIKSFIFILLVLSSISCSDEFLDKDPLGRPSSSVLFATPDGIELMLNAAYAQNREFGITAFGYFITKELGSDDTNPGSNQGDGAVPRMRDFANFTYLSNITDLSAYWNSAYTLIAQANLVITNAPDVEFEDTELQQRFIAEAKVLRAEIYFNLVRGWGGVPIKEEVDFDPAVASQVTPRSSADQVYELIEADLTDAIPNLPKKNEYPGSELGRISQGAAQTLLAQVHLHQGNYGDCLTKALDVIGSNQYSLYPEYWQVSNHNHKNGAESIFEIQMIYREERDMTNNWQKWQGVRGSGSGWGFFSPSEELANAYEAGDPRREYTIYFKGEPWPFSGETNINWAPGTDPRANQKAMIPRPFDPGFAGHSPTNRVVLRYADVLLMAAECYNEDGNTGEALRYLEMVRARVREGLAVLPEITETDKVALRHLIWDERRYELALEGYRAFDIRRYDKIEPGFAENLYHGIGKTDYNPGKHNLYPIPLNEVDFDTEGILEQNPGWE